MYNLISKIIWTQSAVEVVASVLLTTCRILVRARLRQNFGEGIDNLWVDKDLRQERTDELLQDYTTSFSSHLAFSFTAFSMGMLIATIRLSQDMKKRSEGLFFRTVQEPFKSITRFKTTTELEIVIFSIISSVLCHMLKSLCLSWPSAQENILLCSYLYPLSVFYPSPVTLI